MGSQRRRQSAEVYRRRRILVGILAAMLLILAGWLISVIMAWGDDEPAGPDQGAAGQDSAEQESADPGSAAPDAEEEGGSAPEAEDEEQDPEEPSAADETPEGPAEDGGCRNGDLEVRASTGSESYGPGFAPTLVMEVENIADYSCEADLGTAEQEFLVRHSGATVFSTAECSVSRQSLPVELEPGQVEEARFSWPRSDSAEDCSEPTSLSPGNYELIVSLSGVRSEPHDFTLAEG